MTSTALTAPFPYFGGKRRVAHLVWERFGDPANFVEPFFGSGAVLLGRPHPPRIETINDRDCYVSNFWRAIQTDPEAVAHWADYPVSEPDLHARHRWLVAQTDFRERMLADPDFCDPKIAGWWVWGLCAWIGSGWCSRPEWEGRANARRSPRGVNAKGTAERDAWGPSYGINTDEYAKRPNLNAAYGNGTGVHKTGLETHQKRPQLPGGNGQGVHAEAAAPETWQQRPDLGKRGDGKGVHRKMPELQSDRGVRRAHAAMPAQLPDLSGDSGAAGRGMDASALPLQVPYLRSAGTGDASARGGNAALLDWFDALSARLRRVRVCCGDWTRILGPSPTWKIGTTAVFLDPPYASGAGAEGRDLVYAHDSADIAAAVGEWAIANGDNPLLRIALCGYEGQYQMPPSWSVVAWKAHGGYGNQAASGRGRKNARRERIWFSPHCLASQQPSLGLEVPA